MLTASIAVMMEAVKSSNIGKFLPGYAAQLPRRQAIFV
jgi:hypothetical protein